MAERSRTSPAESEIEAQFRRDSQQSSDLSWRWHDDIQAGRVFGFPATVLGAAAVEAHGAMVARTTPRGGPFISTRNASFSLRETVVLADTGVTLTGGNFDPIPRNFESEPRWGDRNWWWPGPDPVDELLGGLRQPTLAGNIGGVPRLVLGNRQLKLEEYWPATTLQALSEGMWLPPAETGTLRLSRGLSAQGAVIQRTVQPLASRALRLDATPEGVVVRFRGATEGGSLPKGKISQRWQKPLKNLALPTWLILLSKQKLDRPF